MSSLAPSLPRWASGRRLPPARTLLFTAVLVVVALLTLSPLALVLFNSFQTSRPGDPVSFGVQSWTAALADDRIAGSIRNTALLVGTRQAIGLAIGILLAWLLARTDIPGREWLEFLFWIAFFLPTLPIALGWILLLDPQYGLLNQLALQLPFIDKAPFNIYSFWGIVWTHLAHTTIATKVILLAPAFRNIDSALEEASHVAGASTLGTLVRIVLPVLIPTISVIVLLSTIASLNAFEIEMILGVPIRYFVFSSLIYWLINQDPVQFGSATVLSSLVLILIAPLIVLQRRITLQRSYATVTSRFRGGSIRLRRWRIPAFLLVLAVALTTTVVPLGMLVTATFMKLFGFFNLRDPWTLDNWRRILGDPVFIEALKTTLILASSVAACGVVLFTFVAYVSVRTKFWARGALDFLSWLPSVLPGIILSLGILWMVLGNPVLRPFYGTTAAFVLAMLVAHMTLGVQMIKSNFVQLGAELEEAGRVAGGSWLQVGWHVVLPLLTPQLLLVGAMTFAAAAKDVSTVALLATGGSRPLSVLQLQHLVVGRYEAAAVVGVIIVLITSSMALTAGLMSARLGLRAAEVPA